ncbi:MAG: 3-dehydroquinate synthase [Deltaproteobacteria bacterium]|nr:3-dehydroquinate synthase [Deltaproteobacteria bacterium]
MKTRTVNVALGGRSYAITIKRGLLDETGPLIKALGFKGRAAIVSNPVVFGLYGERAIKGLKEAGLEAVTIIVPDGEGHKSLKEVSSIYDALIEHKMERSSPIIALGGGVIGDMAGFAAATFLRGVPYIQVPTTLLSQVDSSVGGKTGVNHPKGKNLIGAFYQPRAVFIDPEVLKTLDAREVRAGMAEVVKYGVIRDKGFFEFLERTSGKLLGLGAEIEEAIERSCRIKAQIVGKDETEAGLRSILNFGHTFGHAIEALAGYGSYRHGEAVSIGMVMAANLSASLGLCGLSIGERVKGLLDSMGLPADPPQIPPESFMESMMLDKKVKGGRIRFVLTEDIGKVMLKEVKEEELRAFLEGFGAKRKT